MLGAFLARPPVGQRQRTGTFGQHQPQPQPPQQQIQHVPLCQQPQRHDLQHSLEDLAGWEVQEAAVLVQLIQMGNQGRKILTKLEALEDNLEVQMKSLED